MSSDSTPLAPLQRENLPGVDALRGIAVLLVVLHHIHLRFVLNDVDVRQLLPAPLSRVLFWSGYQAVIAFFVISGFLITRGTLQRWGSLPAIELKRFYWLRIARIWPCLLLLLAVFSVLHLAGIKGFTLDPSRAPLPQAVFAVLTFHFNWLEGSRGYLGAWDVLWSLSVEEMFYVLFPMLCVLLRRGWLLLAAAAALIVAGPLNRVALAGQEPWSDYAYLSCMDAVTLGCLAAWLAYRPWQSATLRWLLGLGVAAVALVLVFRKTAAALELSALGLDVTLLAAGMALILLALAGNVGERTLSTGTAWLRWIGRHSYEVYLFHMFAVMWGVQLYRVVEPALHWIAVWYGAMLLSSLGSAALIAQFYSIPLNRMLRAWRSTGLLQSKRLTGGEQAR